ncbi:MAG: hypothetical protein C5B52_14585 [Bacteroidetes bacterium]|nr:MAG: hypothetical protein C5B52_14585 [Bacteroidota bacterium]
MSTTQMIQQAAIPHYHSRTLNPFAKFAAWTKSQQKNRLLWLALGLAGHGCVATPITIMFVILAGNNLTLFMTAIVAMGITVVVNLAAMPTKITIPVFFFSILVDLMIIATCFGIGFNPSLAF